jgi:hypothetical protein
MALRLTGEDVSRYEYLFKVNGDVVLPRDYLKSIISLNPLLAGYGQAMLISTKFFRVVLNGVYPTNYCDNSYIMAMAIAIAIFLPCLVYLYYVYIRCCSSIEKLYSHTLYIYIQLFVFPS